jgi:DNA-binding NarL/FixJ family response regulator
MKTRRKSVSSDSVTPRINQVRVLVAEESPLDCELLRNTLKRLRVGKVFCSVTFAQILDIVRENEIDLALVSDHFEDGPRTGLQVIEHLFATHAKIRSILLTKSLKNELILDAFRNGAKGVFCRTEPLEALSKCIRAVHQGQIWANSEHLEVILDGLIQSKPRRRLTLRGASPLTNREQEVAGLLADGLTNREIAKHLGLSQHTVNNYLFKSYEKLGLSTRVELVLYVLSQRQQSQEEVSPRGNRSQPAAEDLKQRPGLSNPGLHHPGPARNPSLKPIPSEKPA